MPIIGEGLSLRTLIQWLVRFSRDESGPTMAEYILLVVLIAIVVLIAAKLLGQNIVPLYDLSAFL